VVDPVSLPVRPVGDFDEPRAAAAVRELLIAIGEDPDREGLVETPQRVARAYRELLAGMRQEAHDVLTTTFDLGHDEMVLVKNIELWSMCEHHMVPFTGVAHVGYIPSDTGRITGLSKLARLVDVYARRLQVQGALTRPGADSLVEILRAARRHRRDRGGAPVHDLARGAKARLADDHQRRRGALHAPATRAEAMSLILR
jgi:GTP cyclohydrolase I